MEAHSLVRPLFAALCLTATALGLNNTYGDDTDVKALAEKVACGTTPCVVKTLSEHRSAFKHSFGYQTALVEKGKSKNSASVDIDCTRSYVLLGEYRCTVVSGGLPQLH